MGAALRSAAPASHSKVRGPPAHSPCNISRWGLFAARAWRGNEEGAQTDSHRPCCACRSATVHTLNLEWRPDPELYLCASHLLPPAANPSSLSCLLLPPVLPVGKLHSRRRRRRQVQAAGGQLSTAPAAAGRGCGPAAHCDGRAARGWALRGMGPSAPVRQCTAHSSDRGFRMLIFSGVAGGGAVAQNEGGTAGCEGGRTGCGGWSRGVHLGVRIDLRFIHSSGQGVSHCAPAGRRGRWRWRRRGRVISMNEPRAA